MFTTCYITKEQLDTLRTNPTIKLEYPAQRCQKCSTHYKIHFVKLGSQTDMEYDTSEYRLTQTISEVFDGLLSKVMKMKPSTHTHARIRVENEHFPDLYAGKQVLLAGRCPACNGEIVLLLKKQ